MGMTGVASSAEARGIELPGSDQESIGRRTWRASSCTASCEYHRAAMPPRPGPLHARWLRRGSGPETGFSPVSGYAVLPPLRWGRSAGRPGAREGQASRSGGCQRWHHYMRVSRWLNASRWRRARGCSRSPGGGKRRQTPGSSAGNTTPPAIAPAGAARRRGDPREARNVALVALQTSGEIGALPRKLPAGCPP